MTPVPSDLSLAHFRDLELATSQVKEACLHYDAFDNSNFASYLKSFAAEVSGTKESGYTLTARGLTAATDLIKSSSEVK